MLNKELLSNPINWLTIWLMVLIAGIAGSLLVKFFSSLNSESEEE